MLDIERIRTASSVREAVALWKEDTTQRYLAGGTDVLIGIRAGKIRSASLISLNGIRALKDVSVTEDGSLRIGAMATFTAIEEDPEIRERFPALAKAAAQIGSPQIRNVATIGGNICNGGASADSVPLLIAADAAVEYDDGEKTRTVPLEGFHTGPLETVLRHGEILTAVLIRPEYYRRGAAYIKFGNRKAMEIALLGCAASVRLTEDGRFDDLRLVFNSAAPTPTRLKETEKLFFGKETSAETIRSIAENVAEELNPVEFWRIGNEFKTDIAYEMAVRAVSEAVLQCGGTIR